VLVGPSVCDPCRDKLQVSPDMPRRVIALSDPQVVDRLIQRETERLRGRLRYRRLQ
jgi:hypothetical protein